MDGLVPGKKEANESRPAVGGGWHGAFARAAAAAGLLVAVVVVCGGVLARWMGEETREVVTVGRQGTKKQARGQPGALDEGSHHQQQHQQHQQQEELSVSAYVCLCGAVC